MIYLSRLNGLYISTQSVYNTVSVGIAPQGRYGKISELALDQIFPNHLVRYFSDETFPKRHHFPLCATLVRFMEEIGSQNHPSGYVISSFILQHLASKQ